LDSRIVATSWDGMATQHVTRQHGGAACRWHDGARRTPTTKADVSERSRLPWRLRYVYAMRAASRARRLALLATHRHADVWVDPSCRLGPRFELWIPGAGHLHVAENCDFRRDFYCEIVDEGRVDIGPATTFVSAAVLQVTTALTIGTRCVFGNGTLIADGSHRFRDHTRHLLDQGYDFRPVTIGDGAVVMSKCTITASLGSGSVLAANSVVTRPIPDYCLAAGAPARVVDYFGPPELAPDLG
jgi:acetyltransferase-like isoleucine patch superfamily enzyme